MLDTASRGRDWLAEMGRVDIMLRSQVRAIGLTVLPCIFNNAYLPLIEFFLSRTGGVGRSELMMHPTVVTHTYLELKLDP